MSLFYDFNLFEQIIVRLYSYSSQKKRFIAYGTRTTQDIAGRFGINNFDVLFFLTTISLLRINFYIIFLFVLKKDVQILL